MSFDPVLYSSANDLQIRHANDLLRNFELVTCWGKEETILDVGFGTGEVTVKLLLPSLPSDFKCLVGVDLSADMVEYARKAYSDPRLFFFQEDIATKHMNCSVLKKYADPGFHKIFSFFCLHWVQDIGQAVNNLYKLLRFNGEILLVFVVDWDYFEAYEVLSKDPKWERYMQDYTRFFPPYYDSENPVEEFHQLLEDTGFNIVNCNMKKTLFEFETMEDLAAMVKSVNPFISRIPTELKDEFIQEIIEVVHNDKHTSGPQLINSKKIHMNYSTIEAHATKQERPID